MCFFTNFERGVTFVQATLLLAVILNTLPFLKEWLKCHSIVGYAIDGWNFIFVNYARIQ